MTETIEAIINWLSRPPIYVTVATVLATALLSFSLSFQPIEAYSTRAQAGYLGRMVERVDGPDDPLLNLMRDDLSDLGIAGQLLVVDLKDARLSDALRKLPRGGAISAIRTGTP